LGREADRLADSDPEPLTDHAFCGRLRSSAK
jgi:hypothetical protein